ncbi:MAG: ArnT family glycosyltransferase [Anaerolineales bacterium]
MNRLKVFLHKYPWLAHALTGIGALWYAVHTWWLSRHLTTMILDESMYVYKGWLFVTGQYAAYQDYGPLTNHMPLAFIIPGIIQRIFGPGMATARAFAFITGLVMLAGLWLAFTRLGGKWWGTFIIWVLALSPAWQSVFSQGLTQGLVNAFIAWGVVLLIGEERSNLQLFFSGALFSLAVMTRINTLPILGLILLYVFWQHGWRKGLIAAAGGLAVSVIVLAVFWPGVLKFISGWIPEGLLGFVEPYRSPWSQQHVPDGFSYWPLSAWLMDTNSQQWDGVRAFAEAINFNLLSFLSVTSTLILWPRRKGWAGTHRQRLSVILVLIWLLMAGMHIWVALSGKSCRFFCLAGYFTFFNFIGLLLLPATFSHWDRQQPVWRGILGMGLLFGLVTGTLYTAGYRTRWLFERWYHLMHTEIPRIKDGQILWDQKGLLLSLFESVFKVKYKFLVEILPNYLYWVLLVLLVFGLVPLIYRLVMGMKRWSNSLTWFAFVLFIGLGAALGPTVLFTYDTAVIACEQDVVASHEQVGGELAELIEPGSLVYHALTSNMLFLYLPEIEIFPPQLNTGFNFVYQSDPSESDQIYRFSYWDEYLDREWLSQADVLLIPNQLADDWQQVMSSPEWQQIGEVGPYESCRPNQTVVYVLERVRSDE